MEQKRGRGRPKSFDSVETLESAWEEYQVYCEKHVTHQVSAGKLIQVPNPLIYSVEDFCVFAGITRETFSEYGKKSDYSDTIKGIREAIFARKQRALLNAEGSTTGLIFDMKANYGINEKNIIEHQGGINLSNFSDEDLIKLVDLQNKVVDADTNK